MKKLLSILSLASIATTILVAPAFARPIAHHGDKGTLSILKLAHIEDVLRVGVVFF